MSERPLREFRTSLDPASTAIARNIDAIVRLEELFVKNSTAAERVADWIANFSGSLKFVVIHVLVYGAWILINLGVLPWIPPFDRFPFLLLSVVVSLEAIFLSTFVLIKQNRMSKRADQRAHLDLQINLLSEREMTLILQMLQRISTRLGVRLPDEEIEEFCEETSVEALAEELREKLPDD
jgi:uncharacterized membrane protein